MYRVRANDGRCVRFDVPTDTSYIATDLTWLESEICRDRIGESSTRVTWRLDGSRRRDPAWYFAALQNYYVRLTARHLIAELSASAR